MDKIYSLSCNGFRLRIFLDIKSQAKLDEVYKKNHQQNKSEKEEFKYLFTAYTFGCDDVKSQTITVEPSFIEIKLVDDEGQPVVPE